MRLFAFPIAAAALAGCATAAPPADGPCPVSATEGWRAHVNAMPGTEPPRLVVSGRVTVPTGGWRLDLERGPVREIHPPVQEVILEAEPPSGGATQAIVTHQVTQSFPALPRYGAVIVRCGSDVLAEIGPIETAW